MTDCAPFLTAEWRDLLILTYEVDPGLLAPYLPDRTALDLFGGRALVSLVGFRFLDTRVRGVAIPGHRNFEELNLRFYVTHQPRDGALRRGVVFIKEVVPRSAIAWVARVVYGEPYRALPMRHTLVTDPDGRTEVRYELMLGGRWQEMSARASGPALLATDRAECAFITEHYWGYTRRSATATDEYEVRHPVWRVREAGAVRLTLDSAALYGKKFLPTLAAPPVSAFLAEGSPVAVFPGKRL
jgi:uncharacterized protein